MTRDRAIKVLREMKNLTYVATDSRCSAIDLAIESLSAEPSEQYKKGFEDAKRAFELEYARESENMRKRNAQLEVLLNAQKAIAEPSKSTDQNVADVPSGDLISRQEAIEVGNKIVEELALSSLDWDALKYWAKELFDALPSADRPQVNSTEWVEEKEKEFEELHRPKGEWIVENHEVVCSVCGQNNLETNFCPCCGADMRGDK